MNRFEPDPSSSLAPGRGFNSFTLEEMAEVMDDSSVTQLVGAGGQTVVYELRQVEDISTLRKSMNISASASLMGGIGGGSAKATFFNSIEYNSYSIYLYVHVRVTNASHTLRDYKLTETAIEFLKEYGKDSFFENFGDEFVSGYVTGGELTAIIQINNRTVQEKTRIEASLQGSYGSFSGAAGFSQALDRININNATQVYVMRRGGSGPIPDATTVRALALTFPDTVTEASGNAVLLQVTTIPYALATNRPNNLSLVNLSEQRLAIEQVAELRETAMVARADYRFAATHPYFFYNPDVSALNAAASACDIAINQIDASMRACLLTQGREYVAPTISIPKIPLDWTIPLDVPLAVMVHEEGNGDTSGGAHQYVGTKGENRRIEGISIAVQPALPGLYIEYFVHGEGYADQPWTRDGGFAGTRGQNLRIEGFQIHLTGPLAPVYDVVYGGHFEGIGDEQKQNNEFCGTKGENRRCEGISVSVTRKI